MDRLIGPNRPVYFTTWLYLRSVMMPDYDCRELILLRVSYDLNSNFNGLLVIVFRHRSKGHIMITLAERLFKRFY